MDEDATGPIAPPRRKKAAKKQASVTVSDGPEDVQRTVASNPPALLPPLKAPPRTRRKKAGPPLGTREPSSTVKKRPARPPEPPKEPSSGKPALKKNSVNSLPEAYGQRRYSLSNSASKGKPNPAGSESSSDGAITVIDSRERTLERKEDSHTNSLTSASLCPTYTQRSTSFKEHSSKPPLPYAHSKSVDSSPMLTLKNQTSRQVWSAYPIPVQPYKSLPRNSKGKPRRPAPPPAPMNEQIYSKIKDRAPAVPPNAPAVVASDSYDHTYMYVNPKEVRYPLPARRESRIADGHYNIMSMSLPRNGEQTGSE